MAAPGNVGELRLRSRAHAMIVPTLRRERRYWNSGLTRVAGVDEVGVAPTSGPVVAAAVIMGVGCHRIPGVRDSKTLSHGQREKLVPVIRRRAIAVGVGAASVREIDRINIYHATHLAMRRAIGRLGGHEHVLVDGNRIAGFEQHVGPYTSIVDGDAICYTIACASVVAKSVRDRLMINLSRRYPEYGWERNSGYATREHRAAMRAHGLTPFHRRSFPAVHATLAGEQQTLGLDRVPAELRPDELPLLDPDELAELVLDPSALSDAATAWMAPVPGQLELEPVAR